MYCSRIHSRSIGMGKEHVGLGDWTSPEMLPGPRAGESPCWRAIATRKAQMVAKIPQCNWGQNKHPVWGVYQRSEVYLKQCFHLLCRECYLNQGPETPNAGANWTCKACAPFHFLYRHLYAIDQFNQHPESASYEYPFIAYPSYIEI